MNNRKRILLLALAILLAAGAAFYFSRGYGKTSQLGYELTQALYSACNQQDLERVRKIARLLDEYTESQKLHQSEQRWLRTIISLAERGSWEESQVEARKLLQAQATPTTFREPPDNTNRKKQRLFTMQRPSPAPRL